MTLRLPVLALTFAALAFCPAADAGYPPGGGYNYGGGGYNYGPSYTPPSTNFRDRNYQNVSPNMRHNFNTGSTHIKGVAVLKGSGTYMHRGNGYYVNPHTGNIYNPTTGSYTTGKNLRVESNQYQNLGGVRLNAAKGSVHVPGQFVSRGSGTYQHMGNGYYRNPVTGNVYNPTTGAYKTVR